MVPLDGPQQRPTTWPHAESCMLGPLAIVIHTGFHETVGQFGDMPTAHGDVIDATRANAMQPSQRRILEIIGIEAHQLGDDEVGGDGITAATIRFERFGLPEKAPPSAPVIMSTTWKSGSVSDK